MCFSVNKVKQQPVFINGFFFLPPVNSQTCDWEILENGNLHSMQFKQSTTALHSILHRAKLGDHLHMERWSSLNKVPSKHWQGCCEKVLNWKWWQCWSRHVVKYNWEQLLLPSPGICWFIYLFPFVLFFSHVHKQNIKTAASNKSKSKSWL